jgi:hypothetical protein
MPRSTRLSDQEEVYQQGSAYFIKEKCFSNIIKAINIDGFGIGDSIYTVQYLIKNTNTDSDLFLTDKDEFAKNHIPSISYFTAFLEDVNVAKNTGNIYDTFKKYQSDSFFFKKYDHKKYLEFSLNIIDFVNS